MTPTHKIVGAAAVVAVLAGVGVTAIDYPWHTAVAARQARAAAPVAPVAPALVAAASVTPPPTAAKPPPEASAPIIEPAKTEAPRAEAHAAEVAKTTKKARKDKRIAITDAERVAAATNPPSIDEQYDNVVAKECRRGAFGLLCREAARWRLCNGRWSDGGNPGETRCYVEKKGAEFRPAGCDMPANSSHRLPCRAARK